MNANKNKRKNAETATLAGKKQKTRWTTGKGSEKQVIEQCTRDKFLFGRDFKRSGYEYAAMSWEEVHGLIMESVRTKKYQNIFEHRVNGDVYGGLQNFKPECVLFFDIDDEVEKEEYHDQAVYLKGFKEAVCDVLGVDGPMSVQNSCGVKGNKYKISYHISFPSIHFESIKDLKQWLQQKGTTGKNALSIGNFPIDPRVYQKGYWRLPYAIKKGQKRVMIPLDANMNPVEEMSLKEFKELSIHHVPEDSKLIEVNRKLVVVKRSRSATTSSTTSSATSSVTSPATSPAISSTVANDSCDLLDKARSILGVAGSFKHVGKSRDGSGEIYVATKQWKCPFREHSHNKSLYVHKDHVRCAQCGVARYDDEFLIQNEADVRQEVAKHWGGVVHVERVDGTAIVYNAGVYDTGGRKNSYYDQHSGRLQLQRDDADNNVDEEEAEAKVLAHWGVEAVTAKKKGNKIIYTHEEKLATYNSASGRLVYKSFGMFVEPVYHIWDDKWGQSVKENDVFVPPTVTFDGDRTYTCSGTRLPEIQFGAKWKFEGGVLVIPFDSTVAIQACMGKGKTYTTMRAVKQIVEQAVKAAAQGKKVLYLTYRRSLATQLFKDLCDAGIIKVLHYKDGFDGTGFEPSMVAECNVMVCQLESISKASKGNWDIVMTDEVQGLSAQFNSDTFQGKRCGAWDSWKIVKEIMTRTPTALFMDADLENWTNRAQEFIKTMRGSFVHVVHRDKPKQRKYIDCESIKALLGEMLEALKAGLKVAAVGNTKKFVDAAVHVGKDFKTEAFHGERPLTSDMNINELASRCDMMAISSGAIGSGVSIENKLMYPDGVDFRAFDVVFAYGVACDKASPIREFYQALGRPRDIDRGLYFYAIHDGYDHDYRFKNVWAKVLAGNKQRDQLFRERREAALKAAEESEIRAMQELERSHFLRRSPFVTDVPLDREEMVVRGLIPGDDFCKNLNLVQHEHLNSTRNFRTLFVKRAMEDGHRMYTLKTDKNSKMIEYTPPDRLAEIMAAVPEGYRQWEGWDVSKAVKLKSLCVKMFGLDQEKTQTESTTAFEKTLASDDLNVGGLAAEMLGSKNLKGRMGSKNLRVLFRKLKQLKTKYDQSKKHNALLASFFKDKLQLRDIKKYDSYRYRFFSDEQLQRVVRDSLRWKKVHGTINPLLHETHQKFNQVCGILFEDPVQIKKGRHKGKLAFYEPRGDVLGRLEAVNKLMPLIGSSGNGSDWLKKTDAVFKYFEEQGVKHCFNRIKITNKDDRTKKERAWVLDNTQGLEYAHMLKVDSIDYEKRTHNFDSLRQNDEETLAIHFNH